MVAVSTSAFAAKKKKPKKKTTNKTEIVSVTMHRTACFGRCPTYKVEIDADGMATYRAIMFNDGDSGTYTKNIGAAKAAEVFNLMQQYRLDTCRENYPNRIPDLAGIILTIKYKNATKTIYNAHFGPAFLKNDIAGAIDGAGRKRDKTWKKVSSNPEAAVKK